jgi:Flp pilus assembly protein TadB
MKTRTLVMIGTTAAALLLAAPAVAGQSTRAEREATRQLNLQAAQQAQASNQASTQARTPQFADAAANLPANSPPAAAPTARIESAAIADPQAAPSSTNR